jgi:hypothetical protein
MKSRILVCGGRNFKDAALLRLTMEQLKPYLAEKFCIINGLARGADTAAHVWAFHEGVCSICVPANWGYYGNKAAGPIRNQWMLDFCFPDLVVAMPGGTGTADMVNRARAAGIDVWEVPRDQQS